MEGQKPAPGEITPGTQVKSKIKKATISAKIQRLQPDGTYKEEDLGVVCRMERKTGISAIIEKIKNTFKR